MTAIEHRPRTYPEAVSLVDLLDRVVHRGVVVSGQVVISVAGIDLIYLDLRLLLTSVENGMAER